MAETNPPLFIPDASVVMKWILNGEENIFQARRLRDDFADGRIRLEVPDHFYTEIMNILSRYYPNHALRFFSQLKMSTLIVNRLSLEVASHAHDLIQKYPKISFYDAAYHALALHRRGTFLTADERYYNVVKKEGGIQLLKHYN